MRHVGHATRIAMYRSLAEMIDAHGVTSFDPESVPTDLTEGEADAFARDLEAIRNLPDA